MAGITVVIADDHSLVREGIISLLKRHDNISVVAEASDGKEAIEAVEKHMPDIVLMDIAMPGLGGLEATLEIKKRWPAVKILVLSQYDDREYVNRFLKAGVSGYMLKRAVGSELVSAIKAVAAGKSYLHPEVAGGVIESMLSPESIKEDPYELLTDREKQVLKLIAEGLTQKEVASTLGISVKTAIAHQSNISEKLDMHSKAELIKFAIQKGIIRIER